MLKYYVADAFTDHIFAGNPAGVCIMDAWPSEEKMSRIAIENNLSETAFAVKEDEERSICAVMPRWQRRISCFDFMNRN